MSDFPAFVDGERRCPPEDVGGVPGFIHFPDRASLQLESLSTVWPAAVRSRTAGSRPIDAATVARVDVLPKPETVYEWHPSLDYSRRPRRGHRQEVTAPDSVTGRG